MTLTENAWKNTIKTRFQTMIGAELFRYEDEVPRCSDQPGLLESSKTGVVALAGLSISAGTLCLHMVPSQNQPLICISSAAKCRSSTFYAQILFREEKEYSLFCLRSLTKQSCRCAAFSGLGHFPEPVISHLRLAPAGAILGSLLGELGNWLG
jgi:hypothetical protein